MVYILNGVTMSIQHDKFGRTYQWFLLILLGMVYFLSTATTFTSLGVVLPSMINELGWSWTNAGLGFTLLGLTCGLSSFLPTVFIRKLGVRFTLAIGLLIFFDWFLSSLSHLRYFIVFYRHGVDWCWFYLSGDGAGHLCHFTLI